MGSLRLHEKVMAGHLALGFRGKGRVVLRLKNTQALSGESPKPGGRSDPNKRSVRDPLGNVWSGTKAVRVLLSTPLVHGGESQRGPKRKHFYRENITKT